MHQHLHVGSSSACPHPEHVRTPAFVVFLGLDSTNTFYSSSMYANTHHAHENEVVGLLESLDSRMTDLEDSMTRAQQNLLARSLDRTSEVTAGPSTLEGIEDTIRGLKEEISNLAVSQKKEGEVISTAQQ